MCRPHVETSLHANFMHVCQLADLCFRQQVGTSLWKLNRSENRYGFSLGPRPLLQVTTAVEWTAQKSLSSQPWLLYFWPRPLNLSSLTQSLSSTALTAFCWAGMKGNWTASMLFPVTSAQLCCWNHFSAKCDSKEATTSRIDEPINISFFFSEDGVKNLNKGFSFCLSTSITGCSSHFTHMFLKHF